VDVAGVVQVDKFAAERTLVAESIGLGSSLVDTRK